MDSAARHHEVFRLKPLKAAKVSEISEATAASPVPPEDRVNFHIGNPVQDPRLANAFIRLALGLDPRETAAAPSAEELLAEMSGQAADAPRIEFLLRLVQRSAPYMPRGGYLRNNPQGLIVSFSDWLEKGQPDPLVYDLGQKTGIREVILATGGLAETFRVFQHALGAFLVHTPARMFLLGIHLPPHLQSTPRLAFLRLPSEEAEALKQLEEALRAAPEQPTFLALGTITREETRRMLRHLTQEYALFVVEANNAPNSLSLAREARMSQRVLRFLTPDVIAPEFCGLSTVFVAGNPDMVAIIEVAHFQLKGTPSAPEVEVLSQLLARRAAIPAPVPVLPAPEPVAESLSPRGRAINPLAEHAGGLETTTAEAVGRYTTRVESALHKLASSAGILVGTAERRLHRILPDHDPFSGDDFASLYEQLMTRGTSTGWQTALQHAFLSAFLRHHPEYEADAAIVVSGSSRCALGLLGFHCGIEEVVVPDLSWTYEHCVPRVKPVPLTEDMELDVEGIIASVHASILADPGWKDHGAVAINNPHNATGQAFREGDVRHLLQRLLSEGVMVIDDLAYQNVGPRETLQGPRTLRQLADELVQAGYLTAAEAARVISVHSVSKTDSLAGSRLAVVEIRQPGLRQRFAEVNATIAVNVGAIFLSYLFYRGSREDVNAYWQLRNVVFEERMRAIEEAAANLPAERNRYGIVIRRPTGSMYPLMQIGRLPSGLSLDWLSSGLARQGIGLLPLSAFARTEKGFETGRKAFRLTLGGTDTADRLLLKTRRVLIDLNRMIAEEEARYNRSTARRRLSVSLDGIDRGTILWRTEELLAAVSAEAATLATEHRFLHSLPNATGRLPGEVRDHVASRLRVFRQRVDDRMEILALFLHKAKADSGAALGRHLEREFFKDTLESRQERFRKRMFDRTVHPTQMYSIRVEGLWEEALQGLLGGSPLRSGLARAVASSLVDEYAGLNVAITSEEEGEELLLDMGSLTAAEDMIALQAGGGSKPFFSYWGDWDGSTRPSGQGHRLVATVLIENVRKLASLLRTLLRVNPSVPVDRTVLASLGSLEQDILQFRRLLDEITSLTHQLEKRYRGVLPYQLQAGRLRQVGMRLHLARDPLTSLWQHNDRLERRMVLLRQKRRAALEYYFQLNKSLRKTLHAAIPSIRNGLRHQALAMEAVLYRDVLQRTVITPRIHQKMITALDQFAIDTTVHNITEINEIAGASGNPGMILALQVSMSTSPDALIAVDRKLRARREEVTRTRADAVTAPVWLIPLFEEIQSVNGIPEYLGKLWEYSLQSRRLSQPTRDRFAEMICEVFIAGSDLSQQVGQAAGAALFREAKNAIVVWLAERDLVGTVRIKMGSGEPMQRQGGYYAPQSGLPAFSWTGPNARRLAAALPASVKKSVEYATTPLMGVFAAGDLRTFQSNLAEHVRNLPAFDYAQLLQHVHRAQRFYERELLRAAEPLVETRLKFASRGLQQIERLTVGKRDKIFDEFIALTTQNFRHIVYGTPEDVVGIHIVSYFIARTTPPLRDRPTVRPGRGDMEGRGEQILERIAGTIPLSKYGSLLRAISHNQAQTAVLGINQLTTGLFRAFHMFSARQFQEGTGSHLLADRILPNLPVYEILHTLRLYHNLDQAQRETIERSFPAGNSALAALREDTDAMASYIGPLQRELIRRHGLNVASFFDGNEFHHALLPTVRPDLAVLLQEDLFNTDPGRLVGRQHGPLDPAWTAEVERLLALPRRIQEWRTRAWGLLREPVFTRVQSFVELALALSSLSHGSSDRALPLPSSVNKSLRAISSSAGRQGEDSMQQFLSAAFEYLKTLSTQQIEVPITVVRALQEVERILTIEEQALSPGKQQELRFYLLQIARLAGDNG